MLTHTTLHTRLVCAALALLVAACTPASGAPFVAPTPTPLPPTTTLSPPSPQATPTPAPAPLPLSAPGPYFTGRRTLAVIDASREGRQIEIDVWYPAIRPDGYEGTVADDALPDTNGAPYPLLLSSSVMARSFAPHLVSHGFAWASVRKIDTYRVMQEQMYDQPLDILFALEQVASHPPEGLEGMIDADHAGAIGYSFDGYNALAMSGARIDPEHYLRQCPEPDVA